MSLPDINDAQCGIQYYVTVVQAKTVLIITKLNKEQTTNNYYSDRYIVLVNFFPMRTNERVHLWPLFYRNITVVFFQENLTAFRANNYNAFQLFTYCVFIKTWGFVAFQSWITQRPLTFCNLIVLARKLDCQFCCSLNGFPVFRW